MGGGICFLSGHVYFSKMASMIPLSLHISFALPRSKGIFLCMGSISSGPCNSLRRSHCIRLSQGKVQGGCASYPPHLEFPGSSAIPEAFPPMVPQTTDSNPGKVQSNVTQRCLWKPPDLPNKNKELPFHS